MNDIGILNIQKSLKKYSNQNKIETTTKTQILVCKIP